MIVQDIKLSFPPIFFLFLLISVTELRLHLCSLTFFFFFVFRDFCLLDLMNSDQISRLLPVVSSFYFNLVIFSMTASALKF